MDVLKREYHPDAGIDGFLVELIRDIEKQRKGYRDDGAESRFQPPINELTLTGLNYRNEAADAIDLRFKELGVVSVEELGDRTVVNFADGNRSYGINLDDLARACKLPILQLDLGNP